MKNCAFTIVAKNYIGLARILEESIKLYYYELDFYIIVADEVNSDLKRTLPDNVLFAKEILDFSDEKWVEMSFKYDLTEFCTSIKPASFQYLFDNTQSENFIYLDPDIYFFSSIERIFSLLNDYSIVLTPHVSLIHTEFKGDRSEVGLMSTGVFNLGFCAIKSSDSGRALVEWWHSKLQDLCFIDNHNSLFTDQKWMDFVPCLFSNNDVLISRDLGLNIAPWNFFERYVFKSNDKYLVCDRNMAVAPNEVFPVVFVHYSGYDYSKLKVNVVFNRNIPDIRAYEDVSLLTNVYAQAIFNKVDVFDKYISESYSYNLYNNNIGISIVHRRLYRSLLQRGVIFQNPFFAEKKSFYSLLQSKKMISKGSTNLNKLNKNNLSNLSSKLKLFNFFMQVLYNIIGFKKYFLLIRLLRPYGRYESQIHLLDKRFNQNNIF